MANEEVLGPRKTMFVLVIVVGCFAILWPRILSPLLLGTTRDHLKPNQYDREAGCCEVIFEREVEVLELFSEICTSLAVGAGNLSPYAVAQCKKAVNATCGVDITAYLKRNENVGKTTKALLETMKSSNSSCLHEHFGVPVWTLSSHSAWSTWQIEDKLKQERPPIRGMGPHPALRERGRAIPAGAPTPPSRAPVPLPSLARVRSSPLSVYFELDIKPPPIPGMRPPLGSPGGPVPAPKSSMGFVMPIYTICIIVFFVYTLSKILFKRTATSPYDNVIPDPQFHRRVFRNDSRTSPESKLVVTAISGLVAEVQQEMEASYTQNQQRQDAQDNFTRPYTNGTVLSNSTPIHIIASEYQEAPKEKTVEPQRDSETRSESNELLFKSNENIPQAVVLPLEIKSAKVSDNGDLEPKEVTPEPSKPLTDGVESTQESRELTQELEEQITGPIEPAPEPKLPTVELNNLIPELTYPISEPENTTLELREPTPDWKEPTPEPRDLTLELKKPFDELKELSPEPKEITPEQKESTPEEKEPIPELHETAKLTAELKELVPELEDLILEPEESITNFKEPILERQKQIVEQTVSHEVKERTPELKEQSSEPKDSVPELADLAPEPKEPTLEFTACTPEQMESISETKHLSEPSELPLILNDVSSDPDKKEIDLIDEPTIETKMLPPGNSEFTVGQKDVSAGISKILTDNSDVPSQSLESLSDITATEKSDTHEPSENNLELDHKSREPVQEIRETALASPVSELKKNNDNQDALSEDNTKLVDLGEDRDFTESIINTDEPDSTKPTQETLEDLKEPLSEIESLNQAISKLTENLELEKKKEEIVKFTDQLINEARLVTTKEIEDNLKEKQSTPELLEEAIREDFVVQETEEEETNKEDQDNASVKVVGMEMTAHAADGGAWPPCPPLVTPPSPAQPPRVAHEAEEVKSIFLQTEIPQQSRVLVADFQDTALDAPAAKHTPLVVSGKMTLSLIQDAPQGENETTVDEFTTADAVTQGDDAEYEIEDDLSDEEIEVEEIEEEVEEEEEEEPEPVVVKKK